MFDPDTACVSPVSYILCFEKCRRLNFCYLPMLQEVKVAACASLEFIGTFPAFEVRNKLSDLCARLDI